MTSIAVDLPRADAAPATRDRKWLFILTALLILLGVIQSTNMFRFPYYQDAEGTTMANGWALLNTGKLSPYTYAYEEAPGGTVIMAIWLGLNGNVGTFGFPINAGRVLMLVAHLINAAWVFLLARKLTKNDWLAGIAILLYSFSPLVTVLSRRVLVDNLALVWLLGAVYMLLGEDRKLMHFLGGALLFGLAALTKTSFIYLLPALIIVVIMQSNKLYQRFSTTLFVVMAVFMISFYGLYALLNQELFPYGSLFGGDSPHVSLLERLNNRGPETGRFLNIGSGFSESFTIWVSLSNASGDPVLIYGGAICALFTLLMALDNKLLRPLVVLTVGYMIYLAVGGQVFDSSAIGLLPLLVVNVIVVISGAIKAATSWFNNGFIRFALTAVVLVGGLYPFITFYSSRLTVYTTNQIEGQLESVQWVKTNLPKEAVLATDNYAFVELRGSFPNTHHYWKVDTDPAIKFNVLKDDVCSIDYIIATPQVYADASTYGMDLMKRLIENSRPIITFPNNGWPVEIRQVNKVNCVTPLTTIPTEP